MHICKKFFDRYARKYFKTIFFQTFQFDSIFPYYIPITKLGISPGPNWIPFAIGANYRDEPLWLQIVHLNKKTCIFSSSSLSHLFSHNNRQFEVQRFTSSSPTSSPITATSTTTTCSPRVVQLVRYNSAALHATTTSQTALLVFTLNKLRREKFLPSLFGQEELGLHGQ